MKYASSLLIGSFVCLVMLNGPVLAQEKKGEDIRAAAMQMVQCTSFEKMNQQTMDDVMASYIQLTAAGNKGREKLVKDVIDKFFATDVKKRMKSLADKAVDAYVGKLTYDEMQAFLYECKANVRPAKMEVSIQKAGSVIQQEAPKLEEARTQLIKVAKKDLAQELLKNKLSVPPLLAGDK